MVPISRIALALPMAMVIRSCYGSTGGCCGIFGGGKPSSGSPADIHQSRVRTKVRRRVGKQIQCPGSTLTDQIEILERLGGGKFGDVYDVQYEDNSSGELLSAALKVVVLESGQPKNEATIMAKIGAHSSIVKLLHYWKAPRTFGSVQQARRYIRKAGLEHGDKPGDRWLTAECEVLFMLLEKCEHDLSNPASRRVNFFTAYKDLVLGLHHIHQSEFIHRDIKMDNIFVSKDGSVKIGDFGTACLAKDWKPMESDTWILAGVLAPEKFQVAKDYDTFARELVAILKHERGNNEIIPPLASLFDGDTPPEEFFVKYLAGNTTSSVDQMVRWFKEKFCTA